MQTEPLKWWGNDARLCGCVERELSSWLGTKYQEGQHAKGIAVDCRYFVMRFLDSMFKAVPTRLPPASADVALHMPNRSLPIIRRMREAHYGSEDLTNQTPILEPGDILTTVAELSPDGRKEHEAHVMVVGGTPWGVYHALPRVGVVRSSIAGLGVPILKLYRPRRKDLWAILNS